MNEKRDRIRIEYYSDVLCVWAYVAQIKLDELRRNHGERVTLDYRFVPVFGSVPAKFERGWADRGGLAGYAKHAREVVERFDHVGLHEDAWSRVAPPSSLGCHALLKAAEIEVGNDQAARPGDERPPLEQLAWDLRLAFFRDARDISRTDVQMDVAQSAGFATQSLRDRLEDGRAWAALHEDHERAGRQGISGSPTFVLNENRQRLYGNIGYRVLDANVQELLRDNRDRASWC